MKAMDAVRLRIQHYLKERNLTVTGLACVCGITQSTVENIMAARYRSTNLATIQKICDGLEIDLPTFFCPELFDELDPVERKNLTSEVCLLDKDAQSVIE